MIPLHRTDWRLWRSVDQNFVILKHVRNQVSGGHGSSGCGLYATKLTLFDLAPDMAEIKEKLQSFRIVETQKWKEMAADQSIFEIQIPEHIVAPSGSWAAKVSHHLHVPSFTTLNIRNGETGDPTSPCTRIVLDDAFDHNTHFMYDHFHRRESFSPFKGYPPHLRSIHEDHTTWIRKTISAKIEIIYGRRVQRWAEGNLRLSNLQ